MATEDNLNPAQFNRLYHGTQAKLSPGDYVEPGHPTNYPMHDEDPDREDKVWATPSRSKAAMFALGAGKPHVYEVKPTGSVHWDEETQPEDFESNRAMNRKGSRRSSSPFEVVKEVRASAAPNYVHHNNRGPYAAGVGPS